ncbi:hypothetical protein N7510_002929 [Penicillium lagena]|uniref:uncharacterized protein n=1 Tax=Penicillium lagena TaxID=94218 RepID=UPI0025411236|nr:uncharacterized protein N7510_002929 [Penicillium lagena]KAJ5618945.1 hypothetical protein N7510_002929 [Penicillium lagena]
MTRRERETARSTSSHGEGSRISSRFGPTFTITSRSWRISMSGIPGVDLALLQVLGLPTAGDTHLIYYELRCTLVFGN